MKIILFFIDGLGLGDTNEKINPYCLAKTPFLDRLMGGHRLYSSTAAMQTDRFIFKAIDANLGVDGLPQSATGQTTIWTGVNAAENLGRHRHGLPNSQLKGIIGQANIYNRLIELGKSVTFANAYRPEFFVRPDKHISVSTYAAQCAGIKLRSLEALRRGDAVYQDITHHSLQEWGYDIPIITPAAAAANLVDISTGFDFTVFEYFQTDIAGHRQDWRRTFDIWALIDSFIGEVLGTSEEEMLLVITSDHGNMEDLSHHRHTRNPVPLLGIGNSCIRLQEIKDLTDITPVLVKLLKEVDSDETEGNLRFGSTGGNPS